MPGKFRQLIAYGSYGGGANVYGSASWCDEGTWFKTWWTPKPVDWVLWTRPYEWQFVRWTYWLNETHLEARLTKQELSDLWPGHPRHELEMRRALDGTGLRRDRRFYLAKAKAKANAARTKAKAKAATQARL